MAISLAALLIPIIQSPSAALADVFSEAVKQVRRLQSMSYRQQMTVEGQPRPIVTQEFVAEDGRGAAKWPAISRSTTNRETCG